MITRLTNGLLLHDLGVGFIIYFLGLEGWSLFTIGTIILESSHFFIFFKKQNYFFFIFFYKIKFFFVFKKYKFQIKCQVINFLKSASVKGYNNWQRCRFLLIICCIAKSFCWKDSKCHITSWQSCHVSLNLYHRQILYDLSNQI